MCLRKEKTCTCFKRTPQNEIWLITTSQGFDGIIWGPEKSGPVLVVKIWCPENGGPVVVVESHGSQEGGC